MSQLCSCLHGGVEDHPTLLLQLPMRVHPPHIIPPSAYVLHLISSHLHHCDLDHHLLLVNSGTSPSLVVVFVSRSVLAFSLAECWEALYRRPQQTTSHDQAPSDRLENDEQHNLAPFVRSLQSCAVCLHRCEHLCAYLQLVDVDWSICIRPHRCPAYTVCIRIAFD
jgi:hypothetical protein